MNHAVSYRLSVRRRGKHPEHAIRALLKRRWRREGADAGSLRPLCVQLYEEGSTLRTLDSVMSTESLQLPSDRPRHQARPILPVRLRRWRSRPRARLPSCRLHPLPAEVIGGLALVLMAHYAPFRCFVALVTVAAL